MLNLFRRLTRVDLRPVFGFVILASAFWADRVEAGPPPLGAGRIEVTHGGKVIPVWYYAPEQGVEAAPVLFVMHGVNRDADRYRNEWLPHAQKHGVLLIVPEFSAAAFPGEQKYNQGNVLDATGKPTPPEELTFTFIEPIFDEVTKVFGNRSSHYQIYGHSAGAQFVHRFLYLMPEARVKQAVAANAGFWTEPDGAISYPYGMQDSGLDAAAEKAMLAKPLIVLLGTEDIDSNDVNLRRTPEAMKQGPHRFARGKHFFETGRRRAAELRTPFGWRLCTAPGVPHKNSGMAPYAMRQLFGPPVVASRDTNTVRILFGGDTGTAESYQEQYVREGGVNVLVEKGYDYGLEKLEPLLRSADFRVINLETPLTLRRDSQLTSKDYLHYADPVKMPELFAKFGPVAYSLANNHTLDQGAGGLDDTRVALMAANAEWFGGGENLTEAARPLVQRFDVGGKSVTLAVFGAFEYRTDYDKEYHFYAGPEKSGTAAVDVAALRQAIAELKRTSPEAYVVYFVHWGGNYSWKNEEQTKSAAAIREAGVDLLIGHGAHALQEVTHDGNGWIFYSIGNLLFNTRGRYAAHKAVPYSLPLVLELTPGNGRPTADLRAYPILSDNQLTDYQPRLVTDEEAGEIEKLLAEKGAWTDGVRAAVRCGKDDLGPCLEFGRP
ncbi:MAG: CapA family protein [Planctomycetales bacterium]|nr:CapA family protein [Planctomycetales bacterium]MBN8625791.1 CapA family protein [Planctomycetota bacterium]